MSESFKLAENVGESFTSVLMGEYEKIMKRRLAELALYGPRIDYSTPKLHSNLDKLLYPDADS